MSTGNIGTCTLAYSSLAFIARHQKWGGVHMKTSHPTKKPNKSIDPVAVAHPAIEAALPAKPPMTIFEALVRLSESVYSVKPNTNTLFGESLPAGMGRFAVRCIILSMSLS